MRSQHLSETSGPVTAHGGGASRQMVVDTRWRCALKRRAGAGIAVAARAPFIASSHLLLHRRPWFRAPCTSTPSSLGTSQIGSASISHHQPWELDVMENSRCCLPPRLVPSAQASGLNRPALGQMGSIVSNSRLRPILAASAEASTLSSPHGRADHVLSTACAGGDLSFAKTESSPRSRAKHGHSQRPRATRNHRRVVRPGSCWATIYFPSTQAIRPHGR